MSQVTRARQCWAAPLNNLMSNLPSVHLLYQGLVSPSTLSETTGAQVQVSGSFAQRPVGAIAELHVRFTRIRLGPINMENLIRYVGLKFKMLRMILESTVHHAHLFLNIVDLRKKERESVNFRVITVDFFF